MTYVDGFVLAVPTANKEAYKEHAEEGAEVFLKYGALQVFECWGDEVPDGELTSFPMAVKCKEDETVCFSWIVWPSKEAREAGMEKCMADPYFQGDASGVPYDGNRMIFGSFETLVSA